MAGSLCLLALLSLAVVKDTGSYPQSRLQDPSLLHRSPTTVSNPFLTPRGDPEETSSDLAFPQQGVNRTLIEVTNVPTRSVIDEKKGFQGTRSFPQRSDRLEEDEVSELLSRALENGELFGPEEWADVAGKSPNKGVQRDTSAFQDTHNAKSTLSAQRPSRDEEHHQGHRRLFQQRQDSTSSYDRMQSDSGQIVFPTEESEAAKFIPGPAPVCSGSTFCEEVSYYPHDYVKTALRIHEDLKYLSHADAVVDVVQRIDSHDEYPLCDSTQIVVYPKSAENKDKEWLFILNQDNFTQGVQIEQCLNPNKECRGTSSPVASGHKMTCKQKYIYRQMAAIASNGSVVTQQFRLPSSCCCHIKFTGDAMTRIGVNLPKDPQSAVQKRKK
ncbi:neurotrophin 1 [Orussus abietinus]|uniref:neurotrophin 1 n=1 Tax=Orussus abietinus TaxID=222816 RepID=UPI000624FC15|nr:neurotrophin 1 [Orussus abietinus]